MKKLIALWVVVFVLGFLAGCKTVNGFYRDGQSVFDYAVENSGSHE